MFFPHAHDQAVDSKERLDDSSDESSDTVDVSYSECSTSSDSDGVYLIIAVLRVDFQRRKRCYLKINP